jgi:hypothetical protein
MAARKTAAASSKDTFFSAQLYRGGASKLRRSLRELSLYREQPIGQILVSLVEDALTRERNRRART